MLNSKNILITGGTGTFGKKFIQTVLENYQPEKLIVFSRDEFGNYSPRSNVPDVDPTDN